MFERDDYEERAESGEDQKAGRRELRANDGKRGEKKTFNKIYLH